MKPTLKMLLAISAIAVLQACSGVKPPKTLHFIAREQPEKIVSNKAFYQLFNKEDVLILEDSTNEFGYFRFKTRDLAKKTSGIDDLKIQVNYQGRQADLKINRYNPVQDIYIDPQPVVMQEDQRVADMHYHVSMRTHNSWGYQFYGVKELRKQVPANLNWNRLYKDICVYEKRGWKKPRLSTNLSDSSKRKRMQLLLEGEWVTSTDGANNLKRYSQATQPHMLEGNVYLAYNAISPFEHSISNEGIKRLISSSFKSGVNIKWLKTMGGKKGRNFITHWDNFNREYHMITGQDTLFNHYQWSYLRRHDNIEQKTQPRSKPLVVNVVEGGHILQDKYFPHFIDFNIADDQSKEKLVLFDRILQTAGEHRYESPQDSLIYARFASAKDSLKRQGEAMRGTMKRKERMKKYRFTEFDIKMPLINEVLTDEVNQNIDSLKRMDIFMMAISHLSYNGMTGHAPALDVSKKPFIERIVSAIVKRAYGNRVSEDRRYRKSFDGLFYSVPGVNKFGDSVLNRLLDPQGGRIHIDLKHSDVLSRKAILDKYEQLDSLPPICSHCGVNGLPVDYNSPFINEYRLLESGLARKFYTFGINLYNQEVERIVASRGIIGIPLEERVLGGYVNNKVKWPLKIDLAEDTVLIKESPHWKKRRGYMRKVFKAVKAISPEYKTVSQHYQHRLASSGIEIDDRRLFKLICEEYLSAESFLNNLFHIIDISKDVKEQEARESKKTHLIAQYESQHPDEKEDDAKRAWQIQQQMEQLEPLQLLQDKKEFWKYVCIGSDLDGLIDPINICPTASQYPQFKEKLELFIPLYLYIRERFEQRDPVLGNYDSYNDYFDSQFTSRKALDMLFYSNLRDFTINNFNHD